MRVYQFHHFGKRDAKVAFFGLIMLGIHSALTQIVFFSAPSIIAEIQSIVMSAIPSILSGKAGAKLEPMDWSNASGQQSLWSAAATEGNAARGSNERLTPILPHHLVKAAHSTAAFPMLQWP